MSEQWRVAQFLLGVEGLALLRQFLVGDPRAAHARVREIEELCRRFRDARPGDLMDVEDVGICGYDALASTYDHVQNSLRDAEEPPMHLLFDALQEGCVLDGACGTGRHARYLVDRGQTVVGVDASDGMLREAKRRLPGVGFLRGDLQALPIETNSHDAAVCALVLSHLPEIHRAIAELARVVRPGGTIILSDIHPIPATTGAHVVVGESEGKLGLIKNYFHPHSRYFAAFNGARLHVMECIEPPLCIGTGPTGRLPTSMKRRPWPWTAYRSC